MSERQRAAAKSVFTHCNTEIIRLRAERQQLLHEAVPHHATSERSCHSQTVIKQMDVVAKFSENAAKQQEVWLHSIRQFIFQVCSPLNIQRLLGDHSPQIPDFPAALQLIASSF